MLPPQQNQLDLENLKIKDKKVAEQRISDLKEKMRILVETPLCLNGDLLEHDLFIKPY
jgi:hypothetical protein